MRSIRPVMTREQRNAPARLGNLETEIMAVVWEKDEATVQEVKNSLEPGRAPASFVVALWVVFFTDFL